MDWNKFEYKLKQGILKLQFSDISIIAQAFDVLNNGFRSMDTDEIKSKKIMDILTDNSFQGGLEHYHISDIIRLLTFANDVEVPKETWDKILYHEAPDIPKEHWGVHETHCCLKHGCKYGNPKCPVETGKTKQKYPCEYCSEEINN